MFLENTGINQRGTYVYPVKKRLVDVDIAPVREFVEDMLTFIILYNNLIPISLIVTMEIVKFWQAQLINSDLDMYYEKTDTPALCRTSSLVEELGQIEYIFSDKTGTLTCNEMEFRMCSVGGIAYADVVDESKKGEGAAGTWRTFDEMRQVVTARGESREQKVLREFLSLLAVCHTVIPEIENGKVKYQASSPDEAALVAGSELLGYRFHVGVLHMGTIAPYLTGGTDSQTQVCFRRNQRHGSGIPGS